MVIAVAMAGAAVSWHSRKQEVVARSTPEAEYISLCSSVMEVVWTRKLLLNLGLVENIHQETAVNLDNQGNCFGQKRVYE